jgi:hypothetical protein
MLLKVLQHPRQSPLQTAGPLNAHLPAGTLGEISGQCPSRSSSTSTPATFASMTGSRWSRFYNVASFPGDASVSPIPGVMPRPSRSGLQALCPHYTWIVLLEKFQRNAFFREIEAGGLDPNECDLTEGAAEVRISHKQSGSYFLVADDALRYTGSYVVGTSTFLRPYVVFTWPKLTGMLRRWAREVKDDIDTPDLWAELQRERESFTDARYQTVENTPFTPNEREEITKQLQEIREYAKNTYSLSIEQMSRLEERLDDAEEATRRIGRKDWRLLFLGAMLTLIVAGLVPPEAIQHLLAMALDGLDHLFGDARRPQLPPMT